MHDPLLDAILNFELDEKTVAFPFAHRLARENDWSLEFAHRVIVEYKRFIYLAVTAGHSVTPSVEVDETWHLHLSFTRSYWTRLCGEVLDRPLHHDPTEGGEAEDTRYLRQYEQTLSIYRSVFGEEPPADIWPSASIRFNPDFQPRKIVPALQISQRIRRSKILTASIASMAVLSGCVAAELSESDVEVLLIVGIVVFIVAVVSYIGRRGGRGGKGGRGGGTGCGGIFGCGGDGGGCGGSGCGGGGCGGGCGS